MTQLLFLWENLHFGLYLSAGLATLSAWWLYFDASHGHRTLRVWAGLFGWLLLAAGFFLGGARVETILIDTTFILSPAYLQTLSHALRLLGYILLGLSIWAEPLQPEPQVTGYVKKSPTTKSGGKPAPPPLFPTNSRPVTASLAFPINSTVGAASFALAPAASALLTALGYLRRATTGLERHLFPLAGVFSLLSLFELAALAPILRDTSNPTLYALLQPFGLVWAAEHTLLALALALLLRWLGQYLLRRLKTQLLMIFISMAVGIFLVTTVSFTLLLLHNLQTTTLERLLADGRALHHTLTTTEQQTAADARLLSQDPRLLSALTTPDSPPLGQVVGNFLLEKQRHELVITNADGVVLFDGVNPENIGASLSDHPFIRRGRDGESASGFLSQDGPVGPLLFLRAVAPITQDGQTIGTVMTGTILDNSYLDSLKTATGLDLALYADTTLAASTVITSNDQLERWIGTTATDTAALTAILEHNETYTGATTLINTPYLAAFIPLHDLDDRPIGALEVGIPELDVLKTAGRSLQLTFVLTTILMMFSLLPATYFAFKIARQVR